MSESITLDCGLSARPHLLQMKPLWSKTHVTFRKMLSSMYTIKCVRVKKKTFTKKTNISLDNHNMWVVLRVRTDDLMRWFCYFVIMNCSLTFRVASRTNQIRPSVLGVGCRSVDFFPATELVVFWIGTRQWNDPELWMSPSWLQPIK